MKVHCGFSTQEAIEIVSKKGGKCHEKIRERQTDSRQTRCQYQSNLEQQQQVTILGCQTRGCSCKYPLFF